MAADHPHLTVDGSQGPASNAVLPAAKGVRGPGGGGGGYAPRRWRPGLPGRGVRQAGRWGGLGGQPGQVGMPWCSAQGIPGGRTYHMDVSCGMTNPQTDRNSIPPCLVLVPTPQWPFLSEADAFDITTSRMFFLLCFAPPPQHEKTFGRGRERSFPANVPANVGEHFILRANDRLV